MPKRMEALWRIVAFLYVLVLGLFVTPLVALVGLIWGAIDVVWQLIVGSDGLSASSRVAMWVRRVGFEWPYELTVFAVFGNGQMQWLP